MVVNFFLMGLLCKNVHPNILLKIPLVSAIKMFGEQLEKAQKGASLIHFGGGHGFCIRFESLCKLWILS